jgi:hypothetical protein
MPRNWGLTIIIQSHPAKGVADVLRELRDGAVNHERPLCARTAVAPANS